MVNPDNYVASNIAAGSTHYGFWFFPEPKVRGASEFEPGSDQVCPQGTPLLWFADNEAHHCGSYGLRIFTNDPAREHRHTIVPQLGPSASSGRAWRLWAARHSRSEAQPLGAQPSPQVLKRAASKVAAFDQPPLTN